MAATSVKGRRSVDTEMNAESFEYIYFPLTETVLYNFQKLHTRILAFHIEH